MANPRKSPAPQSWRVLNRDGTLNVSKQSFRFRLHADLYHSLIAISWTYFFFLIITGYVFVNLFFGTAYFLCGPSALDGVKHWTGIRYFLDCFFFSVQTIATIGYGNISPSGLIPNFLVVIEAFLGLMTVALVTGLLFARFSKPTSGVVFSNVAIMGNYDGVPSLVFRVANQRLNQIVEARVSVALIKNEFTKEGEKFRRLYDLRLERDHSPLFALSWTVVHPICEQSPLFGMDEKKLTLAEIEILISFTGIDATVAQPVHARFSYTPDDITWNARFKDMIHRRPDRKIEIDLHRIHETEPLVVLE